MFYLTLEVVKKLDFTDLGTLKYYASKCSMILDPDPPYKQK